MDDKKRVKNLIAHRRRSRHCRQHRKSGCCGWCGRRYDAVWKAPKRPEWSPTLILHRRGSWCHWLRSSLNCSDAGSIVIRWQRRLLTGKGSGLAAAAGTNAGTNCPAAAAVPADDDPPLPANSPTPIQAPMLRHWLFVDRNDYDIVNVNTDKLKQMLHQSIQ